MLRTFKTRGAPFPSHFFLHDGSANYLSFQMPVRCQTHSLAVFYDNLHCITSTMAQVPVLVAKFLFNNVQLSAMKSPSSICILRCQSHTDNNAWLRGVKTGKKKPRSDMSLLLLIYKHNKMRFLERAAYLHLSLCCC